MNVHLTVQVPRSRDLDQAIEHVQRKLDALLVAFDPGLVQLQGRLVRHSSREGVTCGLNLHLPTAQLSSEETAATAQLALRGAAAELIQQVHKHKERLRTTRPRPRPATGRREPEPARVPGLPVARGAAGMTLDGAVARQKADLAGYFGGHYAYLLGFIRRQIEMQERLGEVEPDSLDPAEVLDEVIVAALAAPEPDGDRRRGERQGAAVSRGRWLLVLAADAIRRLTRTYGPSQHGQEVRPLEVDPLATDEPDPEELAATNEVMDELAEALQTLPGAQRHDLVLWLLEGFHPEELAMLSRRSEAEVSASLAAGLEAVRRISGLPDAAQERLRLGPASRTARHRAQPEA